MTYLTPSRFHNLKSLEHHMLRISPDANKHQTPHTIAARSSEHSASRLSHHGWSALLPSFHHFCSQLVPPLLSPTRSTSTRRRATQFSHLLGRRRRRGRASWRKGCRNKNFVTTKRTCQGAAERDFGMMSQTVVRWRQLG